MAILNPVHLKTFLAVARNLSYTRAAREVFLSQPAVSRQIQQLEVDLGVPLFEQIGRSLHLTEAGLTLQGEAGRLLADLERVSESVARHRTAGAGRVRIGAGTTPGTYLLPRVLGRFHRKQPEVELGYVVGRSRNIERRVRDNELDIGFLGGPPTSPGMIGVEVAKDEIHCFCSSRDPLAGRSRLGPRDLEGRRWIIREAGSATRELFEGWLAENGVAIEGAIEMGSPEAVRTLVAAGLGIGYMSRLAIRKDTKRKRLVRLKIRGMKLTRSIHLVRHRDKHLSPALRAFLVEARREMAIPDQWAHPGSP